MEDLSQEPLGSLRQPMELYTVFTAVHCANLSVEIVVTIRVSELAEVPCRENIERKNMHYAKDPQITADDVR